MIIQCCNIPPSSQRYLPSLRAVTSLPSSASINIEGARDCFQTLLHFPFPILPSPMLPEICTQQSRRRKGGGGGNRGNSQFNGFFEANKQKAKAKKGGKSFSFSACVAACAYLMVKKRGRKGGGYTLARITTVYSSPSAAGAARDRGTQRFKLKRTKKGGRGRVGWVLLLLCMLSRLDAHFPALKRRRREFRGRENAA